MNTQELIEKYSGLVKYIVKEYSPVNRDMREQLEAAGTIGLWKALQDYDPNLFDVQIQTFALPRIRWEVLNTLKEFKSQVTSLDSVGNIEYTNPPRLWEFLPDNLSIQEKEIINLKFERYTNNEISKLLGTSESSARRKLMEIYQKIRRANSGKKKT